MSLPVSTSLRFSIANARLHTAKREPLEAIVNYIAVLRSLSQDGRRQFTTEFLKALKSYLAWERNRTKVREVLMVSSSLYQFEFGVWRVWAEWLHEQGEYQCIEYTMQCIECTMQCIECTMQCIGCTMQCIECTM